MVTATGSHFTTILRRKFADGAAGSVVESLPQSQTTSHPDGERFNERLFVDLCDVVDVRGNRYCWLVAVDQHTDYMVIAPCPSHESQAVAKKMFEHWTRWAGPPDVLVCDGERGLGASEIFTDKLSVSGALGRGALAHPSDYRLQELVRLSGQGRERA